MKRTLLIGLDGMSVDVWQTLVSRGWLPRFSSRIKEVCSLRSTIPALTAPAWTSIATGLNPGRHGVLDFWTRPSSGMPRSVIGNSTSSTFWEIASAQGFGVGIFNYPLSYPPREVNGFWVSGMNTPRGALDFVSPARLVNRLQGFEPDLADDVLMNARSGDSLSDRAAFLEALISGLDAHLSAGLNLIRAESSDRLSLFVFALTTTDRYLHYFWDCVDNTAERLIPAVLTEASRRFWLKLDAGIAAWVDALAPDGVMLFSDHGFSRYPRLVFNVPVWLSSIDWISGEYQPPGAMSPMQRIYATTKDALNRRTPRRVWNWLRKLQPRGSPAAVPLSAECLYGPVVGLTAFDEFRSSGDVIERAIRASKETFDDKGEPVFLWAKRAAEVWPGASASFPDAALCLRADLGTGFSMSDKRLIFSAVSDRYGDHSPLGILGIDHVVGMPVNAEPVVWDIAPLALHSIGAAIPYGMDGAVPDWIPGDRLYFEPSTESHVDPSRLTKAQENEITERLRALGYLD